MKIIKTIAEMRRFSRECGHPTAFVPTMGYLHEGNLSLIEIAKEHAPIVIVSIFINQAQFNQSSDFESYPKDFESDIKQLEKLDVDILFMPSSDEVYPNGIPEIKIDYPRLTGVLCGKYRPGHMQGVMLVVHNLFQWIKPSYAIFGLKDYQQYTLIKHMSKDLGFTTEIIGGELIREADGLALSSRNARLQAKDRNNALEISKGLFSFKEFFRENKDLRVASLLQRLRGNFVSIKTEYLGLYHTETLQTLRAEDKVSSALVAVAAWVGGIRLIDNIIIEE